MLSLRLTVASLFLPLLITFAFLHPELQAAEINDHLAPPKLLLKKIAAYYQAQLDDSTETYFKNFPEFDREHTKELKAYISAHYPLSQFMADVLPLTDPGPYRRAQYGILYRHGKEFRRIVQDTENMRWSDSACYAMQRLRGIYVSKFIEKDAFKEELFASCKTHWEVIMAGSSPGEIDVDKLGEWLKEFEPVQEGDRFFIYSISFFLDGVDGIFQVRNHKTIKSVTTFPNSSDPPTQ